MKNTHQVGLSSAEIAGLWTTYMGESMAVCMLKHLLQYTEDDVVKPLSADALQTSTSRLHEIERIFTAESYPIPRGYSDEDIDLSAPSLFFSLFPLSFTYATSSVNLTNFTIILTHTAREDIRKFFSACVDSSKNLYNRAVDMMLNKGIYDRPALIPYPERIEWVHKKDPLLSPWLESDRPLDVLELSGIFSIIERNYFAVILLTAFIQVVKDEEIQQFLLKGKKLANKQIRFFNDVLMKEDLMGNIMVNTEVTASTVSPFSDRLMLGMITMTNSVALSNLGSYIGHATRVDLISEYSKLMVEMMKYGKNGLDLMIKRGWLEEAPHALDRKALAKR